MGPMLDRPHRSHAPSQPVRPATFLILVLTLPVVSCETTRLVRPTVELPSGLRYTEITLGTGAVAVTLSARA